MSQELRVIPGYSNYAITPNGEVINRIKGKWLKPYRQKSGYYSYHMSNVKGVKHVYAHRLVALAYLGNPGDGYEIDHKDENKGNNHWSNLQWITHKENVSLSFKRGNRNSWWKDKTRPSPELETKIKMSNAKKVNISVFKGDEFICSYDSMMEFASAIKLTRSTIWAIRSKYNGEFRGYRFVFGGNVGYCGDDKRKQFERAIMGLKNKRVRNVVTYNRKAVNIYRGDVLVKECDSVNEVAAFLDVTRVMVHYIRTKYGCEYNGMRLEFGK